MWKLVQFSAEVLSNRRPMSRTISSHLQDSYIWKSLLSTYHHTKCRPPKIWIQCECQQDLSVYIQLNHLCSLQSPIQMMTYAEFSLLVGSISSQLSNNVSVSFVSLKGTYVMDDDFGLN